MLATTSLRGKQRNAENTAPRKVPRLHETNNGAGTLQRRSVFWQNAVVHCLVLALATFVLYSRVSKFSFVEYDDPQYITENPHIQSGVNWDSAEWALTATYATNWHPLTWISHAFDIEMFGLDPGGHHLSNLIIHVFNVLLLFLLLLRVTGATKRSWLVAALFAVHPLNVESVAWVAERKNVLSTLFFLLALGAYGWYARKPKLGRYLALSALFVLALAAKPMVITLPCLLLVLDFWPLRRIQGWTVSSEFSIQQISFSKLVAEKVPLFALSAGSAVVTLIAQRGAMNTLNDYSYFVRITNAFYSYVLYLGKTVLPLRLAAIYPHPENTLGWWKPAVALLILTGISAFAWQQRQRHSYLLSGWLWFLGTLVPVIGLVQVGTQAMADRYAYIPLIGIFVIAVWGAADLANFRSVPTSWRIATAGLLLLAFSVLTWRQTGYWRSSYDLWAHALDVTQDNPVAEENMGTVLQDAGRYEDALPHFRHGAALNPQDPVVHANLAATLAQTGRLQEAIPEYETMIRLAHENPSVLAIGYADLGTVYRHLGSYTESRASYMKSLRIDPQQESALRGLNKLEEAIAGSNPDR